MASFDGVKCCAFSKLKYRAYLKDPGVTVTVGLRVLERLMETFLEPLSEPS